VSAKRKAKKKAAFKKRAVAPTGVAQQLLTAASMTKRPSDPADTGPSRPQTFSTPRTPAEPLANSNVAADRGEVYEQAPVPRPPGPRKSVVEPGDAQQSLDTNTRDRAHELLSVVRKSIRYHDRRRLFY
jgi:hypothetical protein